jgi:alkanesulfonate monooxygenase SsuD/methylene tetrahydromethanopterin reductase-like flavin-dependent oxidoreductase (luciferase family)
MCWPFTRPHSEAELYKRLFEEAIEKTPGARRPTFALMRHTAVYSKEEDKEVPIKAIQRVLGQFENLYKNLGDVSNGFPKQIPLESLTNRVEFDSEMLQENLMFGTPETIISKIKRYEAMGVDEFIYYASMGLGLKEQKRSLELFCSEVMPAFK